MSGTKAMLDRCLDDLESRLDDAQEQQLRQAWMDFVDGKVKEGYFFPRRRPIPPKFEWPDVHINDAQDDFDLMAIHQLKTASDVLAGERGELLNVRSNYGVAIMASQFGCEMVTMDRQQNNLPTCRSLGSVDAIRAVVDRGLPDLRAGLVGKVFDMGERFKEVLASRPKVGKWIQLYHPDAQGPIDTAELIWGSAIFYAFYDDADLLRSLLNLLTDQYINVVKAWFRLAPMDPEYAVHWGRMQKGLLMLRDDSLMNLSPQIYAEFIRPLDQRLFDEFGGRGAIHFCGRADHFIEQMSQMRGLTGVNLSQPQYNDMEKIYQHTVDKGIKLIGMERWGVDAAIAAGRPLRGQVHVQ